MRILIAAPQDAHSSLYLERAFLQLGHSVTQFDYRNPNILNPDLELHQYKVQSQADLTIILKGERFSPEELKHIHPCVLWDFDLWNAHEPWRRALASSVDYFLTPSDGYFDKEFGIKSHYMIEAADLELHKPMLPMPELGSDVCFIGTVEDVPGRDEWLLKIGKWCDENGKTLKIWGSFPGPLSRKWHTGQRAGGTLALEELLRGQIEGSVEDLGHNVIVSSSKIILDRQRNPEIDGVISARVFRVAAAGGFVLMRRTKGLERLFVDDNHDEPEVGTFDDDQGCVEAIAYYLEHGLLRKGIAARGRKRVLKDHTWKVRVEQILKLVGL